MLLRSQGIDQIFTFPAMKPRVKIDGMVMMISPGAAPRSPQQPTTAAKDEESYYLHHVSRIERKQKYRMMGDR